MQSYDLHQSSDNNPTLFFNNMNYDSFFMYDDNNHHNSEELWPSSITETSSKSSSSPVISIFCENDLLELNEWFPDLIHEFTFPIMGVEIDNQLSMIELLKAYGDAMEKEQLELVNVIVKRAREKVSPIGLPIERVMYYLFRPDNNNYLLKESMKNFNVAFETFYRNFPFWKFSHLTANNMILEGVPNQTEVIHIVDFDVGSGIQWSSLFESVSYQRKKVKLSLIKWEDDDDHGYWDIEETKIWLQEHAQAFGLNLEVNIINLHGLTRISSEWLVFNCIPQMGNAMNQHKTNEFLRVAKRLSANMITYNGDYKTEDDSFSNISSLLDKHISCYHAMMESMELTFPFHLVEARTAMECLFVGPLVSSFEDELDYYHRCGLKTEFGLMDGWRISHESVLEAMEMVSAWGEGLYGVGIEGEKGNEIVLKWRDVSLVRVSCWRR
ncbi:scarecrow-like protein 7 [Impatiens glandulifera]|uniref:scarecrow-like protein 7 n=1 Tax=Impatiens glandulifera TaxID=253017 RepID=UPI001FB08356|nr:scarecrow-like protein 7 [Impatiens glandulifera]